MMTNMTDQATATIPTARMVQHVVPLALALYFPNRPPSFCILARLPSKASAADSMTARSFVRSVPKCSALRRSWVAMVDSSEVISSCVSRCEERTFSTVAVCAFGGAEGEMVEVGREGFGCGWEGEEGRSEESKAESCSERGIRSGADGPEEEDRGGGIEVVGGGKLGGGGGGNSRWGAEAGTGIVWSSR